MINSIVTLPSANSLWHGYQCLQCSQQHARGDYPAGCPACALIGTPANLFCVYEESGEAIDVPYADVINLGQGQTPLVAMPNDTSGLFKLELANPTGSHKDRMAAVGVAHARAIGMHSVIAASSGNAGVAIAAYAAAYGLACEIAVTPNCGALHRTMMSSYGSTVTECPTSLARWDYVAMRLHEPSIYAMTNYTLPAVGSPAVAIEGYKSIALELIEQCADREIDSVYVPTARGDLLWGLYLGFSQLQAKKRVLNVPRLIAVEPFERLTKVMTGSDYRASFAGSTLQLSTSGSTATLQALTAMQRTGGHAIAVPDDQALRARQHLAQSGFYFELCAAATWHAYQHDESRLDRVSAGSCSVVIATAHGSRDELTLDITV